MIEVKIQGGYVNAHQEFSVALGKTVFNINLDWISRLKEWKVSIYAEDKSIILVTDAVLNPGMNLLDGIAGYGRFYCYGDQPTIDNIGTDSFLLWVSDDEIQN